MPPLKEPRFLINTDGSPFNDDELDDIRKNLQALREAGFHLEYRDRNSAAIAENPTPRLLIVSGPGTGKSNLFLARIKFWLSQGEGQILVTSFVRKLVRDLDDDVKRLTQEEQERVTTTTLHSLARSILERNRGTSEYRLRPNIKMIGQEWKGMVWEDVRQFHSGIDKDVYCWEAFEAQLYNAEDTIDEEWRKLRDTYFRLTQYYNAVGFPDLIVRASTAVAENAELNSYQYFIIDEYQDFNRAEEILLIKLARESAGLLIVGDDDQVLYDALKQGSATLLRALYATTGFTNAILPFCSRCSYYIASGADTFIGGSADAGRINKIFLPCDTPDVCDPIRVIVCAHPAGIIDYIKRFIEEHRDEIVQRTRELGEGTSKDAFLLILSPTRDASFLGKYRADLQDVIAEFTSETRAIHPIVQHIVDLYTLGKTPTDNYVLRKALHVSGHSAEECHPYIAKGLESDCFLCDMDVPAFKEILEVCRDIVAIFEEDLEEDERIARLQQHFAITQEIFEMLVKQFPNQGAGEASESETMIESEESEILRMNSVELMTIVGSKGLSADHVIILGCDDQNMSYLSKEAFYVALTRARRSLHLITGLKCRGAQAQHPYIDEVPEECIEFCIHSKGGGSVVQNGRVDFCQYIENMRLVQRGARRQR
jgi:superfamily I DNA/RNA helicase